MQISKTKRKPFLAAGAVLLALPLLASVYVYGFDGQLFGWGASNSSNTVDYGAPTKEESAAGKTTKEETITSPDEKEESKSPSGSNNATFAVHLTSINQTADTLQIRTKIDTISNSGTCELTATKGGETVSRTAGVFASASVSTCKGFDIPLTDLSKGAWLVELKVTVDNKTASTEKEITIQ